MDRPVFYYDLGSALSYLAAERINAVLPVPPVWQPILVGAIWERAGGSRWVEIDDRAEGMAEVERRARARGLPPIRWPPRWPGDTLAAMRAATFAQQVGRVVAFSLAAFRQAFAAGRDLSDPDNVLVAAAACELHPKAVLRALQSGAIGERLEAATQAAADRGVRGVPTVATCDRLFFGEERMEEAAAALAAA